MEGEALVIALDLKGVAVSGGSACHSGSTEPSHVLMAMGLDKNAALASLRFSLLKTATDEDVDHVLRVVPEAVEHLRALAPEAKLAEPVALASSWFGGEPQDGLKVVDHASK